jgi:hypothetical protein
VVHAVGGAACWAPRHEATVCSSAGDQNHPSSKQPEAQELIADNLWLTVLDVIDREHEVKL